MGARQTRIGWCILLPELRRTLHRRQRTMPCLPNCILRKAQKPISCARPWTSGAIRISRRSLMLRHCPITSRKLRSQPDFNPNARPYFLLGLNGCQEPRRDKRSAHVDIKTRARVRACISQINTLRIDITSDYDAWRAIGQALASEFGAKEGRRLFHLVSMEYPNYYGSECDEMFNWCRSHHDSVGISTFFYYCLKHGITFK